MKKMNKKGFTIVELVIVIAVIAILAAVLIPTFAGVIKKANQSRDLQAARNAFTTYYASLEASQLENLDKETLFFKGKTYDFMIKGSGVVCENEADYTKVKVDTTAKKVTITGGTPSEYSIPDEAPAVKKTAQTYVAAVEDINGLYIVKTVAADPNAAE